MDYSQENLKRIWHENRGRGLKRKRTGSRIRLTVWIVIWILILGIFIAGLNGIRGAYQSLVDEAPDISTINVTPTNYATFVYDNQGNQTARLVASNSNRIPVTLDMIPKNLQHAFVAIEDERFYEHHGIDIQGILRAAVHGLTTGRFDEGASTITQQLIKNSVFTNFTNETFAESVRRKIQEQYLAVQLEQTMSKDDILVNYLNIINLGHGTLGVQAASLRYFGKSVSTLNLSECAVIAGITQNPTRYDPIDHPENNAKRRQVVLDNMLSQGWITQAEYDEAVADDVYARIQAIDTTTDDTEVNSYFVDALISQVQEDLEDAGYTSTQAQTMLYSGGLHIYSTQDPDIQEICDEEANNADNYPSGTLWSLDYRLSVLSDDGTMHNYSSETMLTWMENNSLGSSMLFSDQDSATALAAQYKSDVLVSGGKVTGEKLTFVAQPQVSLTIEDQRTGDVLAIVGGRGEKTSNLTLNRATGTERQPGSTFKIVSTYAPALDSGQKTLASTEVDEPYSYENGTPVRNWYDTGYRGTVTLRTAIQDSMNIIAVKTLTEITPRLGYEYLLRFGFTTLVDGEEINGQTYTDVRQTLALGGITNGVRNIELNAAYAAIANAGTYIEPKLYSKITDHDGNTILDASSRETHEVIRPATAWLLTSAMEDVVTKGTGTACQISETPVAGKTGTTSDEHDVWFAGYSNYYTCTTWAGYDSSSDSRANLTGTEPRIARTLWQKVMERVHTNLSYSDFTQPSTVVHGTICSKSGLLPVAGLCDNYEVTEYFDTATYPTESCNESYHQDDIAAAQQAAQEAAEQAAIDASPEVAAAQTAVNTAQAALDEMNQTLATATSILQQAQEALTSAQASGDAAAIATATANNDTATTNYNTAVTQQAEAQANYDAAAAQLAAARQAAIAAASVNTDSTGTEGSTNSDDSAAAGGSGITGSTGSSAANGTATGSGNDTTGAGNGG